MRRCLALSLFLLTGCRSPAARDHLDGSAPASAGAARGAPTAAAPLDEPSDSEAWLESEVDLARLIAAAIERNPDLRRAFAEAQAASEEATAAGALDDPVFKYEAWAVPNRKPVAFDRDDTNMFGLMQDFPFPGNLALRRRGARLDADGARERARAAERELVARVKKAYYEYFALAKELEIHRQHVRILEDFERISEAKFRTGAGSQQDVLKVQVELVRLHNDVFAIEQGAASARAAINVLIDRPDGAPLGRPREVAVVPSARELAPLQQRSLEARPELLAAAAGRDAARARQELARRRALLPDFSIGLDYWQMPRQDDGWGGTFSFNLPWLTGGRAAEARKQERLAEAEEAALESLQNQVLFEVRDAWLRVEAGARSVVLFEGELLPKSRQSLEVARANYVTDKASFLDFLDAERSLRDMELGHSQALARYEAAEADLERAIGADPRREP
jgi:outer membrane protein TolC